jgi:hypothetical protein
MRLAVERARNCEAVAVGRQGKGEQRHLCE